MNTVIIEVPKFKDVILKVKTIDEAIQKLIALSREERDFVEDDSAFDLSALSVETGITDLAAEHDYYLYGIPKQGKLFC